ncbi:16237_t:CDS:1 [Gigaspora rosea]|nr:16237_t:CDS:1 [Gigaspora rosea]
MWEQFSTNYEIIIYEINGDESIKNINVKRIKVQTDSAKGYLLSLQFIYNVETNDGERLVTGAQYGINNGTLQTYDFKNNEIVKAISGTYGNYTGYIVIKYLMFQTSIGTKSYGKNDTADSLFTLPAGTLCGYSGSFVDSLGTYVIVEVPTNPSTSNSSSDITPTSFIILSCFTSILGFIILVTVVVFLWRKFYRRYIPTR